MKVARDILRAEAGRIWNHMAAAEAHGLFLNEETITETALLNFALQLASSGIVASPYSKPKETVNGADWEWWFTKGKKAVGFRVQAKRIYPSGSYQALTPQGSQLAKLIAKAGDCYPLIAFYNNEFWTPKSLNGDPMPKRCSCPEYKLPSYWGISIASAHAVTVAKSTTFKDLSGGMIPLHCLLCKNTEGSLPTRVKTTINKKFRRDTPVDRKCRVVETPRIFDDLIGRSQNMASMDRKREPFQLPELDRYLIENDLSRLMIFDEQE
jgi:hypothetical protein